MDHRSIPLPVLRDYVLSCSEITSLRQVAAEVGLGRTTLHSFVNGETNPHPRVRRILGLWYIEKISQAADIDVVRPYREAMATCLSELPAEAHRPGERRMIETVVGLYDECGPRPRWVELLADLAGIPPPPKPE